MNIRKYQTEYRKIHKKELLDYLKNWRKNHKKEIQNYTKNYRKINKDTMSQQHKKYYKTHKEQINKWRKEYSRNRRKNNIQYKIRLNLSIRMWQSLKGICKSKPTLKLLGCSIEFLKNYLESKFNEGMTWKNYGQWHIDHIKPCFSFNLSNPEEQRKCFHYTNLQPLWAADNLEKSNKI